MKIVEKAELWLPKSEEDPDDVEYDSTTIILQDDIQYYYASTKDRILNKSEIDPLTLDSVPIPNSQIWPEFPSGLIQAPQPPPQDYYIKTPSLLDYDPIKSETAITTIVLQEAEVCEILQKSPHPNIAKYFGCLVEDEKIKGLCFAKYGPNLMDRVRDGPPVDKASCLRDIRNGIEHLHSLGLIHCDINPSNIFSDQERFVVGDFDSCTREGTKLGIKRGTYPWTDDCDIAKRENDLDGLSKIERYLHTGKTPEQ